MKNKLISNLLVATTVASTAVGVVPSSMVVANAATEVESNEQGVPEFDENSSNSYYYESLVYKINGATAEVTGTSEIVNNVSVAPTINVAGRDYTVASVKINNVATLASINIPEGVRTIDLTNCTSLTQLNLPNSCTTIYAKGCTGLSRIILPEGVRDFSFSKCSSLVNIKLPNNLSKLPRGSLSYCTSLTSIKLPSNLALIEGGAFCGCSSLASISIPRNVSKIGEDAFYDCKRLRVLKFNGDTICDKDSFEEQYNYVARILVPEVWRGSTYRSGLNSANIVRFTPKTIDEAADIVRGFNSKALNTTTQGDIINKLNELIGDDENELSFSTDSPFTKTNATSITSGSITGTIVIVNNNDTIEVPLEIEIDKLPISASEAANVINTKLTYLGSVDNNKTAADIAADIASDLTDVTVIVAEDTISKIESTTQSTGSMSFDINITDENGDTATVPVTVIINKLPQTVEEARDVIADAVDNIGHLGNNTTKQDIIDAVAGGVTNPDINVTFDPEDPFTKVDSTSREEGSITGTIIITDGTTTERVPVSITLPVLAQTVQEAKEEIQHYLNGLVVNNDSTAQDIANVITPGIRNDSISAEVIEFNKTAADFRNEGSITGTITIINSETGDSESLDINFIIDKLIQTVDDIIITVEDIIQSTVDSRPGNDITEDDVLDGIRDTITNPNISVDFDDEEPFNKVEATSREEGSITGTIVISDGTTTQKVPVNITLPKLEGDDNNDDDNQASVDETINGVIGNVVVDNGTTPEDIINNIKDALGDGYNVTIDPDKPFNKIDATTDATGSITGGIIVTDHSGNEHKFDVDITIDRIVSGDLQAAVDAVRFAIARRSYSNSTTEDSILEIARNAVNDEGITVNFDENNPFTKINATKSAAGSITGSLVLTLTQTIETYENEAVLALDTDATIDENSADDNIEDVSNEDNDTVVSNDNEEENTTENEDESQENTDLNADSEENNNDAAVSDDNEECNVNTETRTEMATIALNLTINKLSSSHHHSSSSSSQDKSNEDKNNTTNTDSNNENNNVSNATNPGSSLDDVVKDEDTTKSDETVINNNEFTGKVTHYKSKASGDSEEKAHYIIVECDKTSTGKLDVDVKELDGGVKTIYCNNKALDKLVTQNEVKADDVVSVNVKAGNVYIIADSSAGLSGVNNNTWYQDESKNWFFTEGENLKTGWLNDKGYMYNLGSDGKMQTGWINDNGVKKYLNTISDGFKGAMKTGWTKIDGKWYYFNQDGSMKTGWFKDWTGWYYLNIDGSMAANTVIDGYTLGVDGKLI